MPQNFSFYGPSDGLPFLGWTLFLDRLYQHCLNNLPSWVLVAIEDPADSDMTRRMAMSASTLSLLVSAESQFGTVGADSQQLTSEGPAGYRTRVAGINLTCT